MPFVGLSSSSASTQFNLGVARVARSEALRRAWRITDRLHNEMRLDADSRVPTDLVAFSVQTNEAIFIDWIVPTDAKSPSTAHALRRLRACHPKHNHPNVELRRSARFQLSPHLVLATKMASRPSQTFTPPFLPAGHSALLGKLLSMIVRNLTRSRFLRFCFRWLF